MRPRTRRAGKTRIFPPEWQEAPVRIDTRRCRRGIRLSSTTAVPRPVLFPSAHRARRGRQNPVPRGGGNSAPGPGCPLGERFAFAPYLAFLRSLRVVTFNLQIVKVRDAVSFGPEPDFTCLREGVVVSLEQQLVVEGHCEVLALYCELQGVPLAGRHVHLLPSELLTATSHDLVKPDIILQGIGTGNIVVILVPETRHESGRLI